MEMPKVTDAHRKLDVLVGSWTGEERISPSPFDPQGGTAIGRVQNRAALDGFAVVQDYEQERGGKVTFRGHGIFRFDGMQNTYVMHWFDSMGMPPGEYRGTFDGNVLMLLSTTPFGQSRATFDFREKGRYVFKMDVSPDGANWHPFMEGSYQKS